VVYYGPNRFHPFVWSPSTGMLDLNNLIPANSGWLLQFANAINDQGQIVGQGTFNGQSEAFLLTPQ
jgi:probable HAF family extracellular repeat protein